MPVEFPYETRVKVDNQHQGHKVAKEKCARSEPEVLSVRNLEIWKCC
jgi:hypothetical protein